VLEYEKEKRNEKEEERILEKFSMIDDEVIMLHP